MAKHKPSVIYAAYEPGRYPNAEVSTVDEKQIRFAIFNEAGKHGFSFVLSRPFAKMIARRIVQCLDDTRAR